MPISDRSPPPMEAGSSSEPAEKAERQKERAQKPGPWPPRIEPFVPNTDHNPKELKSWAKRTGFNPNLSGETVISVDESDPIERRGAAEAVLAFGGLDLEKGHGDRGNGLAAKTETESILGRRRNRGEKRANELGASLSSVNERNEAAKAVPAFGGLELQKGHGDRENELAAKIEIEPILGRRRHRGENGGNDLSAALGSVNGVRRPEGDDVLEGFMGRRFDKEKRRIGVEPVVGLKDEEMGIGDEPNLGPKNDFLQGNGHGNANGVPKANPETSDEETRKDIRKGDGELEFEMFAEPRELGHPFPSLPSGFKCGLTENPGFPRLIFYGLQHYLSLAGSLVFIPLVIVPAMGGTDEQTATVISTMLLVSGVTTILQSYFGTRLPLVQGSSFVYLAPVMVIINSEEFRNLSENKFKHIMRELQGAIIVGSIFQTILGYSGLMSLLLRLINPVVVAPTVAAVGLAFFSYGFPQAGSCMEISIPLIVLVLVFSLYLRKAAIFGHRVFLVYAVPLGVVIVWAIAFFLTAGGAYNFKDCSANIPSSNILLDACRRHALTMKHCRTDVSNAWKTAAWVRVPYPFQWGSPTFSLKTSTIMIIVSLVASVDSVGSYHATSLLINLRPPSPGIVSRGIGLEGCSSMLAGLWGTGTGSTTLIENIHTIDATKVANRRAVELGAALLIFFSVLGKVGALLASIPLALAASVLCFTWALTVALGLSTLQYTQTASSRNIIIVGFSLFISLSIPAYIQQYQPISSLILPGYLLPYAAASSGPIQVGSKSLNYVLNALLSLNMVVALFVAFVLDNTVPGSKQERGVYIWSVPDSIESNVSLSDYSLPKKIARFFKWAKWVGS